MNLKMFKNKFKIIFFKKTEKSYVTEEIFNENNKIEEKKKTELKGEICKLRSTSLLVSFFYET